MTKQRENVPEFGNWENETNVPYTVFFDKTRQNKRGKKINPNDPQQNPNNLKQMAKQRPENVLKFGNWENKQNVPYTVFFEEARQKYKGRKMKNPYDPQQNPELFAHLEPSSLAAPPKSRTRPEEPIGRAAVRPAPEPRDGEFRQFNNSSSRNESNYGGRGQRPASSIRPSVGSELGLECSTHQPQPQPKVMERGTGSPAWEGHRSLDSSHDTPYRSRLRPVRVDQSPAKRAAWFGKWDKNKAKICCFPWW